MSLHVRLLVVAAVTSLAALLFAFFSIGQVMEDLVRRGVDEKLDTQIEALASAVTPSGELATSRIALLPGFKANEGWGWEVRTPAGNWAGGTRLDPQSLHIMGHHRREDAIVPGRGRSTDGETLYVRQIHLTAPAGESEIIAASPAHVVDEPISEALGSIILSLTLLGVGLGAATLIQLRYGLRPLRDLSAEIGQVRLGERKSLSLNQPKEIRPLAEEVNALIDQNAAGLEHARRHLSNLAHGLKTPLATLSIRLAKEGVSAENRDFVTQLDNRIAHHLRRARSAALGDGGRSRTQIAAVAADLIETLRKMHSDRGVALNHEIDPELVVAVERQDFEEIMGNLIDNAARFARSIVNVKAQPAGRKIEVSIEDDGPGMSADEAAQALQRGRRLDEREAGYGFGLSIAQELAELYGGALSLGRSNATGGLRAVVALPRSN